MWGALLACVCLQASPIGGPRGVMFWQREAAGQLFTSEADHAPLVASGVTSVVRPAVLQQDVSDPFSANPWQLPLTCLGMCAFALFAIVRRLRKVSRPDDL